MHMSSNHFDESILKGDKTLLGHFVWKRLNPDQWPFKLSDLPPGSALVGGAVRNALLNSLEGKLDLDLVVPQKAIPFTKELAKKIGGKYVLLDSARDMARLVIKDWCIDFTSRIGCTLEEDLSRRDYRMNAIALTIGLKSKILDPIGGLDDIYERNLVATSERNLIEDPLRLLRGVRLVAELHLSLDRKTKNWIKVHSILLQRVAPERIQAEIQRLIRAPWADQFFPFLKDSGLLQAWQDSSFNFKRKVPSSKDGQGMNAEELNSALPLARLTHLLSDEGLNQLRFSQKQLQRCKVLREWQQRNDGSAFKNLPEVERLQLHKDLKQDLPALILDFSKDEKQIWLDRWRDLNDPLFHPSSPLDGHCLQKNLGVSSGRDLGQLMSYLCHERAFGRLKNRQDALEAASYWWKQNHTLL